MPLRGIDAKHLATELRELASILSGDRRVSKLMPATAKYFGTHFYIMVRKQIERCRDMIGPDSAIHLLDCEKSVRHWIEQASAILQRLWPDFEKEWFQTAAHFPTIRESDPRSLREYADSIERALPENEEPGTWITAMAAISLGETLGFPTTLSNLVKLAAKRPALFQTRKAAPGQRHRLEVHEISWMKFIASIKKGAIESGRESSVTPSQAAKATHAIHRVLPARLQELWGRRRVRERGSQAADWSLSSVAR